MPQGALGLGRIGESGMPSWVWGLGFGFSGFGFRVRVRLASGQ